ALRDPRTAGRPSSDTFELTFPLAFLLFDGDCSVHLRHRLRITLTIQSVYDANQYDPVCWWWCRHRVRLRWPQTSGQRWLGDADEPSGREWHHSTHWPIARAQALTLTDNLWPLVDRSKRTRVRCTSRGNR